MAKTYATAITQRDGEAMCAVLTPETQVAVGGGDAAGCPLTWEQTLPSPSDAEVAENESEIAALTAADVELQGSSEATIAITPGKIPVSVFKLGDNWYVNPKG